MNKFLLCLSPFIFYLIHFCIACTNFAISLVASLYKLFLFYCTSNVVCGVHDLIHLPSDVLHPGPRDIFLCFPYESIMSFRKYSIHGPRNPVQRLNRRICEAVAAQCLPPSTTMDNCGNPMTRFVGCQNPFCR